MSPDIRPGARVLVRHDRHHPCGHHTSRDLPLFQQVGVVDRLDERYGEHRGVVVVTTHLHVTAVLPHSMEAFAVSTAVNSPGRDEAEMVAPLTT